MAVTEEMLSGRSEIDRRVFPRCFRGDTGPKASGGPRFDALGAGRWALDSKATIRLEGRAVHSGKRVP